MNEHRQKNWYSICRGFLCTGRNVNDMILWKKNRFGSIFGGFLIRGRRGIDVLGAYIRL